MNLKFIRRAIIVGLAFMLVGVTVLARLPGPMLYRVLLAFAPPPAPTPLPPTITAPRGPLPEGVVGLQEWGRYQGEAYAPRGSGFLLRLDDGIVIGVTTAHSVDLGNPQHPLERLAFSLPGQRQFVVECDTLHGLPGTAGTAADAHNLVIDWILLKVNDPVDPALALTADPRGAPQPGERVSLFSGLGDGAGGQRALAGTVQSVDEFGAWMLMDETFDAGGMSGSPIVSHHTGQVVGMTMAVTARRDRILIGFHPIGHLVELAQAAAEFPTLADYQNYQR